MNQLGCFVVCFIFTTLIAVSMGCRGMRDNCEESDQCCSGVCEPGKPNYRNYDKGCYCKGFKAECKANVECCSGECDTDQDQCTCIPISDKSICKNTKDCCDKGICKKFGKELWGYCKAKN